MKLTTARPYADPDAAAAKLLAIAGDLPVDKGRICVGDWNTAFLRSGGSVAEYTAGRDRLIADGVVKMHASGGFVERL